MRGAVLTFLRLGSFVQPNEHSTSESMRLSGKCFKSGVPLTFAGDGCCGRAFVFAGGAIISLAFPHNWASARFTFLVVRKALRVGRTIKKAFRRVSPPPDGAVKHGLDWLLSVFPPLLSGRMKKAGCVCRVLFCCPLRTKNFQCALCSACLSRVLYCVHAKLKIVGRESPCGLW